MRVPLFCGSDGKYKIHIKSHALTVRDFFHFIILLKVSL